jgi:glutamate/tyrosine decarboxylase-like PLP-dependent enzyme
VPADLDDSAENEVYLNQLNQAVLAEIQAGGELYVSNAIVAGRYVLRACIVNFRTLQSDIDELPEQIAVLGRRIDARLRKG